MGVGARACSNQDEPDPSARAATVAVTPSEASHGSRATQCVRHTASCSPLFRSLRRHGTVSIVHRSSIAARASATRARAQRTSDAEDDDDDAEATSRNLLRHRHFLHSVTIIQNT